jgi:Transposase zinc-ribbon domain
MTLVRVTKGVMTVSFSELLATGHFKTGSIQSLRCPFCHKNMHVTITDERPIKSFRCNKCSKEKKNV